MVSFRHTFIRGPAQNDTEVARDSSQCLMSFKNLDTNDEGNVSIIGKGQLPIERSFWILLDHFCAQEQMQNV